MQRRTRIKVPFIEETEMSICKEERRNGGEYMQEERGAKSPLLKKQKGETDVLFFARGNTLRLYWKYQKQFDSEENKDG